MFDEDMLMYDTQKDVDWRTSFGIISFNRLDFGSMKRCRVKILKQSIHLGFSTVRDQLLDLMDSSLKGPGMN